MTWAGCIRTFTCRGRKARTRLTPYSIGEASITRISRLITLKPNGYSVSPLISDFPDYIIADQSIINTLLPQGADIRGSKLIFWGTTGRVNRQKCGLYTLNLNSKLWNFFPVPNGVTFGLTAGAVFSDSNNITHLGYQSVLPNINSIGFLQ